MNVKYFADTIAGFYYGPLLPSLEEQANRQGYTLGDGVIGLQELNDAVVLCRVHRLLTDSQYTSTLNKLHKQVIKALEPLKEVQE